MTEKWNSIFLVILFFASAFLVKSWILTLSDGGNDVLCDIRKTSMVLQGMSPYSVSEWMSPYPPFYFVVVAGILLAGTGFNVAGSSMAGLVFTLRYAAVFFDLATGLVIYFTLLKKTGNKIYALVSLGLYLFVPSISSSEMVYDTWFHGDVFGYFLMALAGFFFVSEHCSLGSLFLGLATIFKIHRILALPLMAIWFYRKKTGFMKQMTILGTVVFAGLVLPVMLVPDCYCVLVEFNSATTPLPHTVSLLNLFYIILPTFYGVSIPLPIINLIWITSTLMLLLVMSWVVWKNYDKLDPIDILVIGVAIWLLPLRQVVTRYLLWFIIPFLMRGRLSETLLIVSIQEIASLIFAVGYGNYVSGLESPALIIFFGVGVICAISESLALYFVVKRPAFIKHLDLGWLDHLQYSHEKDQVKMQERGI